MSKVKPSASNTRARPPGTLFFSNNVTSYPRCASRVAADNPAKPEPMTMTLFNFELVTVVPPPWRSGVQFSNYKQTQSSGKKRSQMEHI